MCSQHCGLIHLFIFIHSLTVSLCQPRLVLEDKDTEMNWIGSLTSEASRMMEETDLNADDDSKADVDRGSWETEEG